MLGADSRLLRRGIFESPESTEYTH